MKKHVLTIAFAALAVVGCSADYRTGPTTSTTRYIVESANGGATPAIISTWNTGGNTAVDTGSVYLTGDTLSLGADGHYRESAWFEGRSGSLLLGRQRWSDHGLWTRSGDSLHFESEYVENVTFDATAPSADVLTTTRNLREEGNVDYAFRRR